MIEQMAQRHGNAITRRAGHRKPAGSVVAQSQRSVQAQGMRGAALIKQGRDDPDLIRQLEGDTFQHLEPWSIDAVVVGQKNSLESMITVRHGNAPSMQALGCEAHWLATRLPDYDDITCAPLRAKLDRLLNRGVSFDALIETLRSHIRTHLDDPQALQAFARQMNMSERTLRRRLTASGVSYSHLLDQIRHERARGLLSNTAMTLAQVAHTLGYSDARVLRRAFKRWTGTLPSEQRRR